jgi:hypothetical protein
MYDQTIGIGVKKSITKINLTIVGSIPKYSPIPEQIPAISESLFLYNFFMSIFFKKDGQGLIVYKLRTRAPFTTAVGYISLTI